MPDEPAYPFRGFATPPGPRLSRCPPLAADSDICPWCLAHLFVLSVNPGRRWISHIPLPEIRYPRAKT